VLLMQIHPGMPPYTDSAGKGTIRICSKSVNAAGPAMNISMRVSIDSRIELVLCDFYAILHTDVHRGSHE